MMTRQHAQLALDDIQGRIDHSTWLISRFAVDVVRNPHNGLKRRTLAALATNLGNWTAMYLVYADLLVMFDDVERFTYGEVRL